MWFGLLAYRGRVWKFDWFLLRWRWDISLRDIAFMFLLLISLRSSAILLNIVPALNLVCAFVSSSILTNRSFGVGALNSINEQSSASG